ncbi:interleukin-13 receptor subunit alpha-2 [Mixophyes fleayi]|uniref:interleukin-13 receptor subunit alpha-2 n=1 Tax=Mixophyes fleayi TaxID=3061075 RepID=UPI003F4D71AC
MWNLNCMTACSILQSKRFQLMSRIIIYSTLYVRWAAAVQTNVDPPSHLQIDDLGYLGLLDISWQPPASMNNISLCTVRYELKHYDTNEERWKSIRTKHQTYRAAFNLGENILIKIRTYLKGACTDEKEILSEWIGTNHTLLPLQGTLDSKIKDFHCINFNFEILTCKWTAGILGNNSNYELQYWQDGMSKKKTCDSYIKSNGINIGCVFGREEFQLFSDFFICVTGIPGMAPIRPSYFIFQLQNLGKPGIPEDLNISKASNSDLILQWKPPNGNIPSHCLKYEIQYKDQTDIWKTFTEQTETTHSINSSNICARVRGKTTFYCADDGYWSDWSSDLCWKESDSTPGSMWLYCAGAIIVILTVLCVAATIEAVKKKKHWSIQLQHKAKELAYEIDQGSSLKC